MLVAILPQSYIDIPLMKNYAVTISQGTFRPVYGLLPQEKSYELARPRTPFIIPAFRDVISATLTVEGQLQCLKWAQKLTGVSSRYFSRSTGCLRGRSRSLKLVRFPADVARQVVSKDYTRTSSIDTVGQRQRFRGVD